MLHDESQSVSRMRENLTSGLTGRDWEPTYDLVNKSLRNRKSGATGYQVYEARHQSFTLLAVLVQILSENIKHYYQLKALIDQGSDQMDYLRFLNEGIDNSIGLLESLPIKDEKVLAELRDFKAAMQKVDSLYGKIPTSPESVLQTLHDQTVAESLRMANSFKDFSEIQEQNSEAIAIQARQASPRGAARMQAETSAEILRSLSQLMRLNTQMLKLQSEQLAMANKASKDNVASFQKVSDDLGAGFSKFKPDMKFVTF